MTSSSTALAGAGAKVFVLGTSGAGKTPVAAALSTQLGLEHIKASEWVRRVFPARKDDEDRSAHTAAMTRFALGELARDPGVCVRYLQEHYDLSQAAVVESVRNPYDFVHLFDPRSDVAVFLDKDDNPVATTGFERGLGVIRAYLDFLVDNGVLDAARVRHERYAVYHRKDAAAGQRSLDDVIDELVAFLRPRVPRADERPAPLAHIHHEIDPLALHVKKDLLYGGDARFAGELVPCRAFVVSAYPGSTITFKVLLPDGAVFSYVPPSALIDTRLRDPSLPELPLSDLIYRNCDSGDFCVHRFSMLQGPLLAYFKHKDLWLAGEYRLTLDWYGGNDLMHLVALRNGQHAFLPHHKLKFGDHPPGFEPYKKLRAEWKV